MVCRAGKPLNLSSTTTTPVSEQPTGSECKRAVLLGLLNMEDTASMIHDEQLTGFIMQIQTEAPEKEDVAMELEALQSIYGPGVIKLRSAVGSHVGNSEVEGNASPLFEWTAGDRIRFEILIPLVSPFEEVKARVLVTLPSTYPSTSPPQFQLLDRYIGAYAVDSGIFGLILRTFISNPKVEWNAGDVAIFDGLEAVKVDLKEWYSEKSGGGVVEELRREGSREKKSVNNSAPPTGQAENLEGPQHTPAVVRLPEGIHLIESEPIIDRKSAFVGRACQISNPSQVPEILAYLMADKRIARAAHPIINAWRCSVNGVLHQDNDDDGETAAGGRLAHLLQILDLDHVLVIVTRYFGGIHLGPDRFKHINAAARNAIELAGLLHDEAAGGKKGKPPLKKKAK